MTRDKWLKIIDMVEARFGIDKDYKESLDENVPGEKHVIEFDNRAGKIKLEWIERAKLKDTKTLYSDRIGSDVKINKIYDEKERVSYMNAYRWNEAKGEWEPIDKQMFNI
jgi:hypothetical protein